MNAPLAGKAASMRIVPYLKSLGIGGVAGLRAVTAPAATLGLLDSPWTGLARLLAAGEYVGDKLPVTPSRLSPPALAARAVSGGWCGGVVAARLGASRRAGIASGVFGALAAAWCGYSLRAYLTKSRGLPDAAVATAEDAFAIWAARRLTRPAA
jgi:uncharacterized membrane protein